MRKYLSFVLCLLIGANVFAQQVAVKALPAPVKATLERKALGTDVVEGTVNFTATRGTQSVVVNEELEYTEAEAMYTTYDLQSNSLIANRMYQAKDGSVAVVTTMSTQEYDASFADRGTGYNFAKAGDMDSWGDIPEERVEDIRTGWPTIAPYGAEGEILVNHSEGLNYWVRTVAGEGEWDGPHAIPNPDATKIEGIEEGLTLSWARVVTTGENNDVVHIFAAATGSNGYYQFYVRSTDLQEWDVQLSPLAMDDLAIGFYAADDYAVASNGNYVSVVYCAGWTSHVMLYESNDQGLTWTSRMVWECPIHGLDWATDENSLIDQCYGPAHASVAIGKDGVSHVVLSVGLYSREELNPNGYLIYYGLSTDGIAYWNDTTAWEYEVNGTDTIAIPSPIRSVRDTELKHALRLWWEDPEQEGYIQMDLTNFCAWMPPHEEEGYNAFDPTYQYTGSEGGTAGDYQSSFGLSAYPSIAVDVYGNLAISWCSPDLNRDMYNGVYYMRTPFVKYKPANVPYWRQVNYHGTSMYQDFIHMGDEATCITAVSGSVNPNEFWFSCLSDDTPGFHTGSITSQPNISVSTVNVFKFTPAEGYEGDEDFDNPIYPEQPGDDDNTTRNVLIEEFTGKYCGYCPDGHRIANEIAAANPGKVFPINIHAGAYSITDYPNLNTTDGNAIMNGFNVAGFPSGNVNRNSNSAIGRYEWGGVTNTQLSQSAEVNISGNVSINSVTRLAEITVELDYLSSSNSSTNYLTIMMLQDSIFGYQSGTNYNQEQIVDGQYCHMHVLRDVITNTWGDAITPTTAGTLITRQYIYEIPEVIGDPNGVEVDLDNIYFLAFVTEKQDGTPTRPVLNVNKLEKYKDGNLVPENPIVPEQPENPIVPEQPNYNVDSLDLNFGEDETYLFEPSASHDIMEKVLVQEDSKIITVGRARVDGQNYSVYVSRHNADGSLDETYGNGGIVFLKVTPNIYLNCANDADFDEDGNLYIAGYTFDGVNNTAFVICLDKNGNENEEYGDKGYVITEYGGGIIYEAIDVDSKGQAVVAGYLNDQILVRRYTAEGNLDLSFANLGTAIISFGEGTNSYAFDIKVLEDGKIILCGDKRFSNADEGMFIWSHMIRLKSNGTLDETFAENGVLYLYAGEYAEFALSLDVQPNGKYLVGGHAELLSNTPVMPRYESFITRVNVDGTIDETFGTNGFVKMEPLQGDGRVNNIYSILAAPDGQIFGAISSYDITNDDSHAYVFNLDINGQFKDNFGNNGIMTMPKLADDELEINLTSLALQDNNLIAGGYIAVEDGYNTHLFLVRIATDLQAKHNYWTPDESLYANNMTIITTVEIDGEEQYNTNLELGAFCNGELRGSARLQYVDAPANRYECFLMVYGNSGDDITFRLYDHGTGLESDLKSNEVVDFEVNATIGDIVNPYSINFVSSVLHSRDLTSGWNWYSTYIVNEGAEGLANLEAAVGTNGIQIKNQTKFVNQASGNWYGTLTSTAVEDMFMIQMSAPGSLNLEGYVVNPAEHPITLGTNWKWISYPLAAEMSVNEAFANANPNNGDYVKSQKGFAQYYEGLGWSGTLKTMTPGMGYMYQNTSGYAKTLVYPMANAKSKAEAQVEEDLHWTADATKYPMNMTVIAVVEDAASDYEVAAFSNGECRGAARPVYIEALGQSMIFMTIYGDDNDNVSFRYYDVTTGEEVNLNEEMTFEVNATHGDVMEPYVMTLSTMGIDEASSGFNIYPNPVHDKLYIETEAVIEEIVVYDVYGRRQVTETPSHQGNLSVDVSDLNSGVYFVQIKTEEGNITKRFVKE